MANLVYNRKAGFNYEFIEKMEAGISLHGFEVKAVKNSQGSLEGAYVAVRGNEAFLIGATIPPYQAGNTPKDYDAMRTRKLLLTKRQIASLIGLEHQKGLTIVPIAMYNKGNLVKLEIAVARGKKKFDKRETIKKREHVRDIEREIRGK